jgi:hypothetical protein
MTQFSLGTYFEWPAPNRPTCGAIAEDRNTGEIFSCLLRQNHNSLEHHWQEICGQELRSVSWIGMTVGYPTMVG